MIHGFLWLICNFICIVSADHEGNSMHHIFEEEQYEIKYCASEDLAEHEKGTCRFYTMIIDAGSTGTRLEIFEFSHNPSNPSIPFKLQKELFVERNPGLSSYSSVPKEAAAVVADLMEEAKLAIPQCLWKHSPVALRATAGFRLLPKETVKTILQEIETVLRDSPFLTGEDPATVLDGTDEGIFGWFTLNYLLDRLESLMQESNAQRLTIGEKLSAAAFDLGGGSTQVTFILRGSEEQYPSSFIKEITLFSKKVKLYSHSYLGNGVMASRLNILRMSGKSTGTVISPCIAVADELNWKFQETNYRILGSSEYGFDNCYKNVRKHVYLSSIHEAGRFILGDLYAFGYFYDHALRIGIISTQGGNVTAAQFLVAAKKACSRTEKFKNDSWKPWQCLDLTYIYSLLVDGYGIAADRNITIVKKLRGMEMSWALGAAHHLINTFHESKSKNNTIITENDLNKRTSEQLTQACTNYWSEFQTYLLSCFYNLMSLFDLLE
ncbi:Nucleoside-diphosphatase uda-1 [Trichinella papuae]|uniref:Nucleoside-diphosphatase uda-1 n=1 Tax=Trichinella papuae TaxID=268474 RepID=A0A0V1MNV8_9BILA|nr:Nucleoside-diphosphatase uda-1 [Trichinella papuae]